MRSCVSWNSSAMRSYRSRSARAMSALLTFENDSSLLPTVTVHGNYNQSGKWGKDGSSGDGLRTALVKQLPTLLSSAADRGGDSYPRGNPTLYGALLPTLNSRDEKGPGPAAKTKGGSDLPGTLGGHLNPEWCLWFMGFPAGWLDVDDAHVFGRSATPSSRKLPKSSAGSSENSSHKTRKP